MFTCRKLVFVISIIFVTVGAINNQGKQFIAVFGDNGIYDNPPQMVQLYITTNRTDSVDVNVTSPFFAATSVNYHFSIGSTDFRKLDISKDFRLVGNELSNKGIIVQADNDIVVFGCNREIYSVDLFLVLPLDSLGVEYYAVSYYPSYTRSQIQVVGVHDNTDVKIKLTNNSNAERLSFVGITYDPGDTILLCINKLDTIQFQTAGDVSGTYISSSKPIAVFSGNKKVSIGSNSGKDHMSEQLRPVNTWGKQFVLATNPINSKGDNFKIISCELNTQFTVRCVTRSGTPSFFKQTLDNPGEFSEIILQDGQNCFLHSLKPVSVTQMFRNLDPAMIIIPPVEQYSNSYTFLNPMKDSFTQRLQVVVDKSKTSVLRLNGKPVQIYFSIFESFAIGHVDIVENTNTVTINTTTVVNFSALLFGDMKFEAYGTPAGINLNTIHQTGSTFSGTACHTPTPPSTETEGNITFQVSTSPVATSSTTTLSSTEEELTALTTSEIATNPTTNTTTTTTAAKPIEQTITTVPSTPSISTDVLTSTASETPTTATSSIPVIATTMHPNNSNVCCEYYHCYSEVEITVMIEELRILRKNTIRYKLSLISVSDDRPSARAIGYSGGIIIAIAVVGIIIVDMPNLKLMICLMRKNVGCLSTENDHVISA